MEYKLGDATLSQVDMQALIEALRAREGGTPVNNGNLVEENSGYEPPRELIYKPGSHYGLEIGG